MHDEAIYAERNALGGRQWLHHEAGGQRAVSRVLCAVFWTGAFMSRSGRNNMIQKFAAGGSYISANPMID